MLAPAPNATFARSRWVSPEGERDVDIRWHRELLAAKAVVGSTVSVQEADQKPKGAPPKETPEQAVHRYSLAPPISEYDKQYCPSCGYPEILGRMVICGYCMVNSRPRQPGWPGTICGPSGNP